MKTNKILMSVGALTILGLATTNTVKAADHTESVQTKGKITFTEKGGPTDPVDPIDPEVPVEPVDPEVPGGTNGPLSIDYVSNFDFGQDNEISGNTETYYAKAVELYELDDQGNQTGATHKAANYLQITDSRGSNIGWNLTVKQATQFTDGTNELKGAKLSLSNQVLNSSNLLPDGSTSPLPNTNLVIGASDSAVMTAAKDQGMGTWTTSFGEYKDGLTDSSAKAVALEVPGISAKVAGANYVSDIVWTLSDVGL